MECWEKEMRSKWTFCIRSHLSHVIHTCRQLLFSFCEFWAHVSLTCPSLLDDRTFTFQVAKDTGAPQAQVVRRSDSGALAESLCTREAPDKQSWNFTWNPGVFLCSVYWEAMTESRTPFMPSPSWLEPSRKILIRQEMRSPDFQNWNHLDTISIQNMGLKDSVKKYKEMERKRNQEGRGKKGEGWEKMRVEKKVQRSLEASHSHCSGSWHLNKADSQGRPSDSTAQHNTHAVTCALDLSSGQTCRHEGC